jgi:hypothetical protein
MNLKGSSMDKPDEWTESRNLPDEGALSMAQLGSAAQKASRQRLERAAQVRRRQVMQIIAVVLGAAVGAIIDGLLFGSNLDVGLRVVCTLFLGTVGALLGYTFIWRAAAFMRVEGERQVQSIANRALVVSLLVADLLPSTWAAAGANGGSLHGYLIVIACEVTALFLVRCVWPDQCNDGSQTRGA